MVRGLSLAHDNRLVPLIFYVACCVCIANNVMRHRLFCAMLMLAILLCIAPNYCIILGCQLLLLQF